MGLCFYSLSSPCFVIILVRRQYLFDVVSAGNCEGIIKLSRQLFMVRMRLLNVEK